MPNQDSVRVKYLPLVLTVAFVALVVALHPSGKELVIEPQHLTVNGAQLGITRAELEQRLGEPTFEKRTDMAAYGFEYSVSVLYDGSEQSSYAYAIHGDELRYKGSAVLKAGQTLQDAERVLGQLLLGVQSEDSRDAYPIEGTNIRVITASNSENIRSFNSEYANEPCLKMVPNRSPSQGGGN